MLLAEAPPRCAALAEFLALAHLKVGCGSVEGVFWISQVDEVKAHAKVAVAAQRSLCGWVRDPIMY